MVLPIAARIFIALIVTLGFIVFAVAVRGAQAIQVALFALFLLTACVSARMKVKLPGITGNMSVNLPFILFAVTQMGMLEAMLVGCISNLVQCLPKTKQKFNAVQVAFNFSSMALAVYATRLIFRSSHLADYVSSIPLRLAIASAGFFLMNTVLVAIIIFLTERKSIAATWLEMCRLSYPYFLASAGVAGCVLTLASRDAAWQVAVILALMLGVFYSYRRFFSPLGPEIQSTLGKQGPESEGLTEQRMHA